MLALECAILGRILFPRNLEVVDVELLQFWNQIEQSHAFDLLADTIRTLCIAKTILSTHWNAVSSFYTMVPQTHHSMQDARAKIFLRGSNESPSQKNVVGSLLKQRRVKLIIRESPARSVMLGT